MKNKAFLRQLELIGFTQLEAKIYEFLLTKGPSPASEVYKDMRLDKSSTYRIIEELVVGGYLTPIGEKYGQQFMVTDPQIVIEKAREAKSNMSDATEKISQYIQLLSKEAQNAYGSHNVSLYEGEESYIRSMEKRLEAGSSPIREIGNVESLREFAPDYENYVQNFIKRRIRKKIVVHGLVRYEDRKDIYEDKANNEKFFKETRYLPPGINIKALISTFGEYTTINNIEGDRLIGIIIKDKLITEAITAMYDLIWEFCKK